MPTHLKRLTITVPTELAAAIRQAVDDGDHASANEVVWEALRAWIIQRQGVNASMRQCVNALSALKEDIDQGLSEVAAGRVTPFDASRIIARGKRLLTTHHSWARAAE